MPKKIDAAVRERALRMFADHRQDYPSDTALAEAVAKKLGIGRETARRWLVQADVNAGARPGATSEEQVEIKRLRAGVKRLREDNEILKSLGRARLSRGGPERHERSWRPRVNRLRRARLSRPVRRR